MTLPDPAAHAARPLPAPDAAASGRAVAPFPSAGNPAPLPVTRPRLPPLEAYIALLRPVWAAGILSNRGPLVTEFERRLADHLGVAHLSVVANATLGLMAALMHAGAEEVVTTPFTFVATANAIRLAGGRPVFADVEPGTLGLDPRAAEACITPRTGAILPVHCYGLPCDTAAFDAIARRHALPVIYDASHAFGVRQGGESLLSRGHMSIVSFHATKVFHSAEGGAVICPDAETKQAIDRLCNHGITDETTVDRIGLNAKMSELHAALGLALLPGLAAEIAARQAVARRYARGLAGLRGLCPVIPPDRAGHNAYAYPVLVQPEFPLSRDALQAALRERGILARRYFHPLIPDLAAHRAPPGAGDLPVARQAAAQVLCLPLHGALATADQDRVIEALRDAARGAG